MDAAREKLPTKKVLKKECVFDEKTGKGKTRLYFEDEVKVPKGQSKLQFEADKACLLYTSCCPTTISATPLTSRNTVLTSW